VCVLEIARPGMEDSESAEKQENTGIGPASAPNRAMSTEVVTSSSCAGLTRASIFFARSLTKWMDCRVKSGNDSGGSERNLRLYEISAGKIPLFPIDINNGNCNPNVFGLRGPYHPHMSPTMWHHPSVSPPVVIMWHHPSSSQSSPRCVTIRRHNVFLI
jgi:hypothetical protein